MTAPKHAVWGWAWLERSWQDVQNGYRILAGYPGFTSIAVLSLAIGHRRQLRHLQLR